MTKLMRAAALVVLSFALGSMRAKADTFSYTETAVASGKFDSVKFKNATVTLTGTGDPSTATDVGGIYSFIIPVTVTVDGIGSGTFKQKIEVFDNNGVDEVGFGDISNNMGILFDEDAEFAAFTLETLIGPVSGAPVFNAGQKFGTTGGALVLHKVSSVSFQASDLSRSIAETPEPSTLALLGTGAALVAAMRRRINIL